MDSTHTKHLNAPQTQVLLDAANLIGTSLDADAVVHAILELLAKRLCLTDGRVVLPNRSETRKLETTYAHGLSDKQKSQGRYAVGEGITGRVMKSGEIAIIRDIDGDPTFLARTVDDSVTLEDRSFIAVPIIQTEKPIGVLAVYSRRFEQDNCQSALSLLLIIAAMIGQVLCINALVREKTERLVAENKDLKDALKVEAAPYDILGKSLPLRKAIQQAKNVALTNATVMLTGESGTGKEKFARMIHLSSRRRDGPFVCINCAAIPAQLLESELFGHEKGSFTGATSAKPGKFELACNGTLFLDEIGDMNNDLQTKLLRVLQERVIQRIGGIKEIPVDVRIISATHKNLQHAVNDGRFRLDLFYRLNVFPIHLPPLRERGEDIKRLARHFLNRANHQYGRNALFGNGVIELLNNYTWPGNIRQLENVVDRAVLMAETVEISENEMRHILTSEANVTIGRPSLSGSLDDAHQVRFEYESALNERPYQRVNSIEADDITSALRNSRGNKSRAARTLGLTLRQLRYRIEKLHIQL